MAVEITDFDPAAISENDEAIGPPYLSDAFLKTQGTSPSSAIAIGVVAPREGMKQIAQEAGVRPRKSFTGATPAAREAGNWNQCLKVLASMNIRISAQAGVEIRHDGFRQGFLMR